MNIITNVSVKNSSESMINNKRALDNSMEKLATGKKINKASDNASGLAIADKLRTQISSVGQSVDNAITGATLTQIADKAISEQSSILDRIKQKLIQAKTATTSEHGRESLAKDIIKLITQLDDIAANTKYNNNYLLQRSRTDTDGSKELKFQVGELSSNTIILEDGLVQANSIGYKLEDLRDMEIDGGLTPEFAGEQMGVIDEALNIGNLFRGDFGMIHNQLKAASRNLRSEHTNLSNAESVIRDTSYHEESSNFSKRNIIAQSGSYAMSQATKKPQDALKLMN